MNLIDKFDLKNPECKHRLRKSELVMSTLAINLLSLALPIMVLQIYDRIMTNHSVSTLYVLVVGVCIAITFEALLRIARAYTTSWSGMIYQYIMEANALHKYINAEPSKLKEEGTGKQIQNLESFNQLKDFYGGQTLVTLVDIPFAFVFLGLIFYLTGNLVFVPLALVTIFTLITWILGKKLMVALDQQDECDDARYNFIIESLQGIHSIKSYGVEPIFQRRYERLEEESSLSIYNSSVLSSMGYSFGILFNEIMAVAVVSFGAPMVIANELSTGSLIATVLLSGRLMQPIQKALLLWNQFQSYQLANDKAEKMFSIEQIDRINNSSQVKKIGRVKLTNVSFSEGENNFFSNINLELKMPDSITIHGEHNSGKAILLKLIAGIIKPTTGEVFIDGLPATKFSSEDLVHHVGFIDAENTMFQGTIMDNLTAFDESKIQEAMEISKILKLDQEIALLPHGYETKINDGFADTIAPGVKQRITIVRVLVNKPKIILFNNADKGLDRVGYNNLIKLLNLLKGQTTMILTSDDHNITNLSDRSYLLKDKQLIEVDSDDRSVFDVSPYKELKL